jgi:DNA polymerase I-like protein with 3'-5' exonuclease and polymerase domains
MTITSVYQPTLFDLPYFKPDVELDKDTIIIGNPNTEYQVERLDEFLEEFAACNIFAFDTETFGKFGAEGLYFKFNYIRLLQIGLESGLALAIDFGGWREESSWDEIKNDEKVKKVLSFFSDKCFDNDVAVLGQNLAFDFNNIRHHFGIIGRQARDLMIISQIVWAGIGHFKHGAEAQCAVGHSLKAIAERLGYGDQVDKTEQNSKWGWTLTNRKINYAINDVRILFPLFAELRRHVNEMDLQYTARAECRAVAVFANMQYLGFPIRTEKAKAIKEEEEKTYLEAVSEFEKYFPDINIASNAQLLEAFKEVFPDLEDVKKETLKTLDHPAAKLVVSARESKKVIDECDSLINYQFDGSIHSNFRQIGPAHTGRSTSSGSVSGSGEGNKKRHTFYIGINLQNASKKVREIFGFDDDSEMCLGIYDGSGMHQRIAAELSHDRNLIEGFVGGTDMHSLLAAQIAVILGEDPKVWTYEYVLANKDEGLAKKYRAVAKKAYYSCLNGSGVGKILIGLHQTGFVTAERYHAQQIYDAYYELYKDLVDYIKRKHKESSAVQYTFDFPDAKFRKMNMHNRKYGLLQTLTGRIQYVEMEESKYGGLQTKYTQVTASNWLLAEGNLLKMWMAEVQDKFWETPEWAANIINMVHDEINLVCLESYKQEVADFVVEKMDEVFSEYITVLPALENKMIEDHMCGICKNWSEK